MEGFLGQYLNEFLVLLVGLVLIFVLARVALKNTVVLSEKLKLSGTFLGMTVLSIGTSFPEIITHIAGSLHILRDSSLYYTSSALVVGTNIGSDIFQQNFILGLVAVLSVVAIKKKEMFDLFGGLIGSAVLLFLLSLDSVISKFDSVILILVYFVYLGYLYQNSKGFVSKKKNLGKKGKTNVKSGFGNKEVVISFCLVIFAFVLMTFVANEVLAASETIVSSFSISASFFGILVLGIAAALPELTTAIVALREGKKEMSIGVLIGSNITNPTFALGIGGLISSYFIPKSVIFYDLPVKIFSALLIFYMIWNYKKLGKREGYLMIGIFIVYLLVRGLLFPVDL